MTKGEKLKALLSEADINHSLMRQLFLKNNLASPEINQLPEANKNEWYRLKAVNDELGKQMCETING